MVNPLEHTVQVCNDLSGILGIIAGFGLAPTLARVARRSFKIPLFTEPNAVSLRDRDLIRVWAMVLGVAAVFAQWRWLNVENFPLEFACTTVPVALIYVAFPTVRPNRSTIEQNRLEDCGDGVHVSDQKWSSLIFVLQGFISIVGLSASYRIKHSFSLTDQFWVIFIALSLLAGSVLFLFYWVREVKNKDWKATTFNLVALFVCYAVANAVCGVFLADNHDRTVYIREGRLSR